ncbi:aldehyde dehydrogenase [Arthrobacter sp. FW305-BF8]|uniref:aldehyde dehydrogenase n=1 Tax=Arthrobacter sp. FW305-BF8 TaxID=2879617 RepID=UPI001F3E3114|nr:aldehyde dehydrogenase [Arthrobacter sp. FW305-BF8]UKA55213.1 aldehyde dehydrogenase [Arthrobacter sp. FW305-BF8]
MNVASSIPSTIQRLTSVDKFLIGGQWVTPSSRERFPVIDSGTEQELMRVAVANAGDMSRAISAAREAFDKGPWPRLSHAQRAEYLRAIANGIRARADDFSQMWPRESGVLYAEASALTPAYADTFDYYAGLADTFDFERPATPTAGGNFGLLVREPVGVVGAITAWNGPLAQITYKVAPALLAGCTVILKPSPEAPGEAHIFGQILLEIGLPAGVVNIVPADREVSELLVRDPRVDKITFTGSTAAGRRIASLAGERVARVTLELGGKSAAVVLDDADVEATAATLAAGGCFNTGQVCSSLTRVIVSRGRHDALVEALADAYSKIRVGDPFDPTTEMGPLAAEHQRDRVESYISAGRQEGATVATGGGRPSYLNAGWYVEPTVFAGVDNSMRIAQEEIFGPVVSVIPAPDDRTAIDIANDTIYGLNASVFTPDVDRAREVAGQLRSGTVGHNAFRTDFGIAFGGFKQSGIGREGGVEGLLPFLETKTMIFNDAPRNYRS